MTSIGERNWGWVRGEMVRFMNCEKVIAATWDKFLRVSSGVSKSRNPEFTTNRKIREMQRTGRIFSLVSPMVITVLVPPMVLKAPRCRDRGLPAVAAAADWRRRVAAESSDMSYFVVSILCRTAALLCYLVCCSAGICFCTFRTKKNVALFVKQAACSAYYDSYSSLVVVVL